MMQWQIFFFKQDTVLVENISNSSISHLDRSDIQYTIYSNGTYKIWPYDSDILTVLDSLLSFMFQDFFV